MARFSVIKNVDANGIVILKLRGSLDADTVYEWEAVLDKVIRAKEYRLIMDLAELTYISSAGVGTFIGCIGEVREKGGDIIFLNLSTHILRIFDLLGFTKLFKVMEDKEAALAAFASS